MFDRITGDPTHYENNTYVMFSYVRSLHRLTIDELKRQVDMLHARERQACEKIDELQNITKDYEHKVEVLQTKLRKLSDDVRSVNVFVKCDKICSEELFTNSLHPPSL